MRPVNKEGKHVSCGKRGKTCNRLWKARENVQLVERAGKHVTGGKRGKTRAGKFATDWIGGGKTRYNVLYNVFSDHVFLIYFHLQYFD